MSNNKNRSAVALSFKTKVKKDSRLFGPRDLRRPGIVYSFTAIDKRMTPDFSDTLTVGKIRKAILKGDLLNCKRRKRPKFDPDKVFITLDVTGHFDVSHIYELPNGILTKVYKNPAFKNCTVHQSRIEYYFEVLQKIRD